MKAITDDKPFIYQHDAPKKVKVITDSKWKSFIYRYDVPKKVLEDDFDWTNEEDYNDGFLKYRNIYYHLSEFLRNGMVDGYDGYFGHSFFSGVAIKISDDGETYKIATVTS